MFKYMLLQQMLGFFLRSSGFSSPKSEQHSLTCVQTAYSYNTASVHQSQRYKALVLQNPQLLQAHFQPPAVKNRKQLKHAPS